MLWRGRTTVPDFGGLSWLDAGVVAVRHRVVRAAHRLPSAAPDEALSPYVVVDQHPRAGTAVPVGAEVTLFVGPELGPAAAASPQGRGRPLVQGVDVAHWSCIASCSARQRC